MEKLLERLKESTKRKSKERKAKAGKVFVSARVWSLTPPDCSDF